MNLKPVLKINLCGDFAIVQSNFLDSAQQRLELHHKKSLMRSLWPLRQKKYMLNVL